MIKNNAILLESTVVQVKGNIVSDMGGEKSNVKYKQREIL